MNSNYKSPSVCISIYNEDLTRIKAKILSQNDVNMMDRQIDRNIAVVDGQEEKFTDWQIAQIKQISKK